MEQVHELPDLEVRAQLPALDGTLDHRSNQPAKRSDHVVEEGLVKLGLGHRLRQDPWRDREQTRAGQAFPLEGRVRLQVAPEAAASGSSPWRS